MNFLSVQDFKHLCHNNTFYQRIQEHKNMSNKAYNNNGLRTIVQQRRDGVEHSSAVCMKNVIKTYHALYIQDAVKFLKTIPDSSIQLVLIDPP